MSGSVEDKRDALFAVRNLHTAEASRVAFPALKDPNELVRASAPAAVIFLPNPDAAKLIIPLLNDKAEFVRCEAAFALGEVADVARARGDISDAVAVSALIRALKHDKSGRVRSAAAVALGHFVDSSAVEALTVILKTKPREEDEYLRRSAARSIGQSVQINRTGKPELATPQNFLPDKYKSGYSGPESTMINWTSNTVNTLLIVLRNPKEAEDTRRQAAFALGNLDDRSVATVLRSYLTSPDKYLAEICKEALLKLENNK